MAATAYGLYKTPSRHGQEYRWYRPRVADAWQKGRLELAALQTQELIDFLLYAVRFSPHYRDIATDDAITSNPWDALRLFPPLSKETLRQEIDRVRTLRSGGVRSKTGGTTGKSLEVIFTRRDFQRRMAALDQFRATHGFEHRRMRRATFNGKHIVPSRQVGPPFWRHNAAMRQKVFSSFHINRDNIHAYVSALNAWKPHAVDGFVSSITDVVRLASAAGLEWTWKPSVVFTTSETLTPLHRQQIEEAWACPVRDQYGSSEGAPLIYECTSGRLHLDVLSGIVESGEPGQGALVTSFTTYGTPLIRYAIGDIIDMAPNDEECDCGWGLPLVNALQGREVDGLWATNGTLINLGNVSNLFKVFGGSVADAQVRQMAPDQLCISVVTTEMDAEALARKLTDEVHHKFGRDMKVQIDIVDSIPKAKSGKRPLVVNEMRR